MPAGSVSAPAKAMPTVNAEVREVAVGRRLLLLEVDSAVLVDVVRRAYFSAKTLFTTHHERITATMLSTTAAVPTASCWLLERTSAGTTAQRLTTAAIRTPASVLRDRLSSSASRSVPYASCGQLMRQTHVSTTVAATDQATTGHSSGAPRSATTAPTRTPTPREISARLAERMRRDGGRTRARLMGFACPGASSTASSLSCSVCGSERYPYAAARTLSRPEPSAPPTVRPQDRR